jgi:hypothetical protein
LRCVPGQRQALRAQGVDAVGQIGVALTAGRVGVGSSVDHDIRPKVGDRFPDRSVVCNIQLRQIAPAQRVPGQGVAQRPAKLPAIARNEDAHVCL